MSVRIEQRNPTTGADEIVETYAGAVLATRERNFHDDSDFYAVVWDEAAGAIRHVEYASTRGWTYNNSATVDATEDVKAKARAYLATWYLGMIRDANVRQARQVKPGRRVRVVAGRKVAIGVTGTVGYVETCNYGRGKWTAYDAATLDTDPDASGARVRHYGVNVRNLEVIVPETYERPDAELEAEAAAWARHDCWHAQAYMVPGIAVV